MTIPRQIRTRREKVMDRHAALATARNCTYFRA
jgi:hypothetical protein